MTPVAKVQLAAGVLHLLRTSADAVRAAGGTRHDLVAAAGRAWDGSVWPECEACGKQTTGRRVPSWWKQPDVIGAAVCDGCWYDHGSQDELADRVRARRADSPEDVAAEVALWPEQDVPGAIPGATSTGAGASPAATRVGLGPVTEAGREESPLPFDPPLDTDEPQARTISQEIADARRWAAEPYRRNQDGRLQVLRLADVLELMLKLYQKTLARLQEGE